MDFSAALSLSLIEYSMIRIYLVLKEYTPYSHHEHKPRHNQISDS